jgi:hypothetical protein
VTRTSPGLTPLIVERSLARGEEEVGRGVHVINCVSKNVGRTHETKTSCTTDYSPHGSLSCKLWE